MDAYAYFKTVCQGCPYGYHDGLTCPANDCIHQEEYLKAHFTLERAKVGNTFKGKVHLTDGGD